MRDYPDGKVVEAIMSFDAAWFRAYGPNSWRDLSDLIHYLEVTFPNIDREQIHLCLSLLYDDDSRSTHPDYTPTAFH